MIVLFTGHRDKLLPVSELDKINMTFPDSVWMHGGAIGFDSQVAEYAKKHNILQLVVRPDYDGFGKLAPLYRNIKMARLCDYVVACYDGRKTGGTLYTIKQAQNFGKEVRIINPDGDR